MAQATPQTQPSFVMDYVILNTSQNNYTFKGDTTYYVSGAVLLSGTTIFEGGAVLKYAANKTLYINPPGIAKTTATAYRPVIFTAKDDNTVGEIISGSTGSPTGYYANPALTLRTPGNPALQYFRFAYAQQAITAGWGLTLYLAHAQFVNCNYGVAAGYYQSLNLNLKNVLFAHVQTPFDLYTLAGGATITAQQVTFDSSSTLVRELSSAYVLYLTNCILASVTNTGWAGSPDGHLFGENNGFYNTSISFGANQVSVSVNPFQVVGAGSYYLAVDAFGSDASGLRNQGTASIDLALLVELQNKTTHRPDVLSDMTITGSPTYSPHTSWRDTDIPDLGYHYDPVDYFFGGVRVASVISFNPGTVVGWYQLAVGGGVSTYGINLLQEGAAYFDGTGCEPCIVARYDTVQEGGNGIWKDNSSLAAISGEGSSTVNVLFTHFTALAGGSHFFRDNSGIFNVSATHCEFWGGRVGGFLSVYNLTNCLFDRSHLKFESDYWSTDCSMAMQNCTMRGGTLEIQNYWDTTVWTVNVLDCAFDATVIDIGYSFSTDSIINCDYNAYLTGAGQLPFGSNNRVVSTFNWQSGRLGNFYLPATSDLVDHGSASSISLGLNTFTTRTDKTPDSDTVDIGFHYFARNPIVESESPTLSVTCLPQSIVLNWTLPPWLQQLALSGFIKDFRIYRCATPPPGTCTPATMIYATVDDPDIVTDPGTWKFVDAAVQPNTVYCYRMKFRLVDDCDESVIDESAYSSTECTTTCCPASPGPFWTDYGPNAQELAEWIMAEMAGSGVSVVPGSATSIGVAIARGTFGNGANANLPIGTGVILCSGDIILAKGPNGPTIASKLNNALGDSDLNNLVGFTTSDASGLEFNITSTTATVITFQYVFASEEYLEFVGSIYDDPFAIFVDGVNIALVPLTPDRVSVNSINPSSNFQYYQDNPSLPGTPAFNIRYDGLTTLLTAQATISLNRIHVVGIK